MTDSKKKVIVITAMVILAVNIIGAALLILLDGKQPEMNEEFYRELAAQVHTSSSSVDFDMLGRQNPDIRAWIISEGTGIDYPVVQGDSKYYRSHLFSGEKDELGCLYIDASCSSDFTDKNTVIYGSKQLESVYKYARQDYYDLLPSMTICTPTTAYTLVLFAGLKTESTADAVKTDFVGDAEFTDYVLWLKDNSVFQSSVSVSESDKLVTLCADGEDGAFVLVGKLA